MNELQHDILEFRSEVEVQGFYTPSPRDSACFSLTEAAELLDAMMKAGYSDMAYLRARPDATGITDELGDLLLMTLTLANQLNIDVEEALARSKNKIRARAWAAGEGKELIRGNHKHQIS